MISKRKMYGESHLNWTSYIVPLFWIIQKYIFLSRKSRKTDHIKSNYFYVFFVAQYKKNDPKQNRINIIKD